jgi:hypothetical protein
MEQGRGGRAAAEHLTVLCGESWGMRGGEGSPECEDSRGEKRGG